MPAPPRRFPRPGFRPTARFAPRSGRGHAPPSPQPTSSKPIAYRPLKRPATPQEWAAHRETLKKLFPEGWNPPKKISREAMVLVRQVHTEDPETFSVPALADRFRISPEAVRRILRSRWAPSPEREIQMRKREMEEDEKREKAMEEWHAEREEAERKARMLKRRVGAARAAYVMLGGEEEDAPAVLEELQEVRPKTQGRQGKGSSKPSAATTPPTSSTGKKGKPTLLDRLRAARARAALEAAAAGAAAHSVPSEDASTSSEPSEPPPQPPPFEGVPSFGLEVSPPPTRDAVLAVTADQPTEFPTLGITARQPRPRTPRPNSTTAALAALSQMTTASLASLSRPTLPSSPPPEPAPPSLARPPTGALLRAWRERDLERVKDRIDRVNGERMRKQVERVNARADADALLRNARMGRSRT